MFWSVLWMLLVGHAVADYPLQSDSMAIGKNKRLNLAYREVPWYYWMASHALVHGGAVTIMTGSVYLGFAECLLHFVIDVLKCEKITTIHIDQFLHVACKVVWAGVVTYFATLK
jgi:hypothetical protein